MSYFTVENESKNSLLTYIRLVSLFTVMLEQELTQEMPLLIVHIPLYFPNVHFSLTTFKL